MNIKFFSVIAISISISAISCKSTEQSKKSNNRQNGHPSVDEIFEKMDANNDGKLSKSEVKGPLVQMFSVIDTNEDGFITKTELSEAPEPENNRQRGERSGHGGGMR